MNISKKFIILVNLKISKEPIREFIIRCNKYKFLEQLIITIPNLNDPIKNHKCKLAINSNVNYSEHQKMDYFLIDDFLSLHNYVKEIKSQKVKDILDKKKSIIFLGERLEHKVDGLLLNIIINQLILISKLIEKEKWKNITLVYKPSNNKIKIETIENIHLNIRKWISFNVSDEISSSIKIIYGGKIKLENYDNITKNLNIDGIIIEDDIIFDKLIK